MGGDPDHQTQVGRPKWPEAEGTIHRCFKKHGHRPLPRCAIRQASPTSNQRMHRLTSQREIGSTNQEYAVRSSRKEKALYNYYMFVTFDADGDLAARTGFGGFGLAAEWRTPVGLAT